ncbi:MAG: hypothetical protein ACMXYC_00440 [Candidatus Woesearchaeota archaeon]
MLDIVFPKNNEHELIEMAHILGYTKLLLLYKESYTPIDTSIRTQYPDLTITQSLYNKPHTYITHIDRGAIEHKRCKAIVLQELGKEKNSLRNIKSGMNHIIAKLMQKNNIHYYICVSTIIKTLADAQQIAKIQQHLFLVQKYKVRHHVVSGATNKLEMKNPIDLQSLLHVLKTHK